jgi:hypothetical protein
MEYPTLVTTGGDSVFSRPGIRVPEFTTVHEVGHNWFQGMLASNEPEEAWLDEGVNEWANIHVMRDLYGARKNLIDWMGWEADIGNVLDAIADDPASIPAPIATAAYAFVDGDAYYAQTYHTAARALTTLENHVGSARFMVAMKTYAREFAFKHPTGRDLFATLERELGEELTWFFDPVFERVGGIAMSVREHACRAARDARGVFDEGAARRTVTETEAPDKGTYVCEVVVQNTGVVHVPVEIELQFADGSSQRVEWDARGHATWQRFVIERSSQLTKVHIDPDRKVTLASPIRHHVRVQGDGSASLRASARIASWTQLLMQLVGP